MGLACLGGLAGSAAPWDVGFIPGAGVIRAADAEGLAHVETGVPAPLFSLRGADGRQHTPAEARGHLLVLEWTSPVCPFTAAAYASGLMQSLQREVRRNGGVWFAVDTAVPGAPSHIDPEAARRRLAHLRATVTAFLYDEAGETGRLYGAKVTPTLYIIDARGILRYQGAPGAAHGALENLRRGRPVAVAETRAEGCPVDY